MSWAQMRFDHKPPDDDLLLDPPAVVDEPAEAWGDPIVEASLLADFQPDSARDAAAVAAPPPPSRAGGPATQASGAPDASVDAGDDALLFSAIGAPPEDEDA